MDYDVIIVGAGLSGLAAGIRLAHFEKKVLIVDSHRVCGGLNSYYYRSNRSIDVGLHAMTNYVPNGTPGAPLTKLLRQLRIRHEDLHLAQQNESQIVFPGCALRFSNDFDLLRHEVAKHFHKEIDSFERLSLFLENYNEIALNVRDLSAREELGRFLENPLLIEMLLEPLMYYGNAAEHDMDFTQFAIMWKSIFRGGFARPEAGMRHVVELLVERYAESGGHMQLGSGVTELSVTGGHVKHVRLASGRELTCKQVLSSAGYVETMRLCSDRPSDILESHLGQLSFVELITFLDKPCRDLGFQQSILFYNDAQEFNYRQPTNLIDLESGVLCAPDNFNYDSQPAGGCLRVTVKASFDEWQKLVGGAPRETSKSSVRYLQGKRSSENAILERVEGFIPNIREHITYSDMFTPLTIKRYSGHSNGAVYGSPQKIRDGRTDIGNLFIIGTDQGFLGIVGAMLSGITVANLYCLR